jgi:signal transduction histidine kinase
MKIGDPEGKDTVTSWERLLARERAARVRAELAEMRMSRLQNITAELSRASTPLQVADVVLTQGLAALRADAGYVVLVKEGGEVEVLHAPGYPDETMERYRRISAGDRLPVIDCIRSSRVLIFESPAAMQASYPEGPSLGWAKTWVCLPLVAGERTLGALGVTYRNECRILDKDRRFMKTLADQCAQAMERARLYEAEQRARLLREEVMAILAHDLRSLLTSILLSASILDRSTPADEAGHEVRRRAQRIKRTAERTSELLQGLLDAASIEAKRLALDAQPCGVGALVAEVVETLSPLAEEQSIRLRSCLPGGPLEVLCDRSRVAQALSNLVCNALKFTPRGGEVTVGAERAGISVRFLVTDTGIGIKPEELPHLFDRYWQARSTRSAGAGLGLYIVKGIVEAHGGRIMVESVPGSGTTFSFTLPAASDADSLMRTRRDDAP